MDSDAAEVLATEEDKKGDEHLIALLATNKGRKRQQYESMRRRMRDTIEEEQKRGYGARQGMFVNLNGAASKFRRWKTTGHPMLTMAKEHGVTMLATAEVKVNGDVEAKQVEAEGDINATVQEHLGGVWTTHLALDQNTSHSGVSISIRQDGWKHKICKGLDDAGRPIARQTEGNDQGRYIIVVSEEAGDIDDYMFIYAPNSGDDGLAMRAQAQMAQEIQRALYYSQQRNLQLNVIGDANFSH